MQTLLPGIEKIYRDPGSPGWGYSYLLLRAPKGNLFLPRLARNASFENEYYAIASEAGGIGAIYITDRHFVGQGCVHAVRWFDAPLYCSEAEYPAIRKSGIEEVRTFPFERHFVEEDLEVIPTPGHTSGGVSFLWTYSGERYLFTGDFLYNAGKHWVVGSKTLWKVQASLETLRDVDYDYLVGCGDDELGCPYLRHSGAEKSAFYDSLLRTGEAG